MTQDWEYGHTFYAENRLIAVVPRVPVAGDGKIESTHDDIGRRVWKVVTAWDTTRHTGAGDWVATLDKLLQNLVRQAHARRCTASHRTIGESVNPCVFSVFRPVAVSC